MNRLTVLLFVCLLMILGRGISAETTQNCPDGDTRCEAIITFDNFVANHQQNDEIAGVAYAIVGKDEIISMKEHGQRDVAANLPVTDKTLFHIGSITKSFTALLVASEVEEGTFTWDTPVVQIDPDFALSNAQATQTVTLRHLVSMRSGVPGSAEDDFDIDNETAEGVFPFLATVNLSGQPGQQYSYSNLASSAAGYLTAIAVTGDDQDLYNDYADLLTDEILRPMGMLSATINVSELENNPNYGKSYEFDNNDQRVEAAPQDFDGDPLAPSGVIKASTSEMAIYLQLQLNRGVAPNGNQIVSAARISELWQPYLNGYALGWQEQTIDNLTIVYHEGEFDNYLSVAAFIPSRDIGLVLLTNTAQAAEQLIADTPAEFVELFGQQTTPLALTHTQHSTASALTPLWLVLLLSIAGFLTFKYTRRSSA